MSENRSGESIEEYLNQHETLTYRNVGVSMLPMLRQGRDLFTLKRKSEERCKKYDVVLYRKTPQTYILHRIIKVRPNDYVLLGDNCYSKEYGVKDQSILGVMTSFVHNGKSISIDNLGYRIYVRVWFFLYPLRKAYKWIGSVGSRILRKIGVRNS